MNWFDNLSLRNKLLLNFLVSGGTLIAALVFCLIQIQSIGRNSEEIAKNWLPSIQSVGELSQLRLRYRTRSLEFLLASKEDRAKIENSLAQLEHALGQALGRYEKLISSEEERSIYQNAAKALANYGASVQEAIGQAKGGNEEQAHKTAKTQWVTLANEARDKLDALVKLNRDGADLAAANSEKLIQTSMTGSLLALVTAVVLSLLASFFIAQRLKSRLDGTVVVAQRVAGGDLSGEMAAKTCDEVGQLVEAVGEMQRSLRLTMGDTRNSAAQIVQASATLSQAVQMIEQSASLQSTAASSIAANVEELTVSINHVSDNTSEASRLASASDEQAQQGNAAIESLIGQINQVAGVVRDAAFQINELKQESEKISSIVAVIRDIADQTNLLALNAAIEAARAGETGRGFAVVADEVRKLAERTALSTGEITAMVDAIH